MNDHALQRVGGLFDFDEPVDSNPYRIVVGESLPPVAPDAYRVGAIIDVPLPASIAERLEPVDAETVRIGSSITVAKLPGGTLQAVHEDAERKARAPKAATKPAPTADERLLDLCKLTFLRIRAHARGPLPDRTIVECADRIAAIDTRLGITYSKADEQ